MRHKNQIITNVHAFVCEALIIFLLLAPFLYYFYDWLPYRTYLLIVICSSLFFSLLTRQTTDDKLYILSIPFIIILCYMLRFSVIISSLLGIILTWRYINIKKTFAIYHTSSLYVRWSFIATTIAIITVNDRGIMLYICLLFFVLISIRFWVMNQKDQKPFEWKYPLYIVASFAFGIIVVYYSFNIIKFIMAKVWYIFSEILIFIAQLVAYSLSLIELNIAHDSSEIEQVQRVDNGEFDKLQNLESYAYVEPIVVSMIILLLLSLFVWIFVRYYRKKFRREQLSETSADVSYKQLQKKRERRKRSLRRLASNLLRVRQHPVRRMMYQFERQMAKTKYRRLSYETIEEWARRINIDIHLDVYKKVRYGNIEVSDNDILHLKQQLERIKKVLF